MDLRNLLETTLPGLGYEFVELELGHGGMVRVFIDKPEGINVEDCATVSNHLTRVFMVENINYERLEVSSPGLDRPLAKAADYERFVGQNARIRLRLPLDGQRKFAGVLRGLVDGRVQLEVEGKLVEIEIANIDKARLDPQF